MMGSLTAGYLSAIALGGVFGFQGAVSPGPLQTVIISESLSHGLRSSWRAACISPVTDPIALTLAVFFVASVPEWLVAAIAISGAAMLCRIAILQFRTSADDFNFQTKPRLPYLTIWMTNILNPNLWIFSFTINAIQINDFYQRLGLGGATAFLGTFFISICSWNLLIAYAVSRSKRFFDFRWLVRINHLLGVFLLIVALRFLYIGWDALTTMN